MWELLVYIYRFVAVKTTKLAHKQLMYNMIWQHLPFTKKERLAFVLRECASHVELLVGILS